MRLPVNEICLNVANKEARICGLAINQTFRKISAE